MRSACVLFFACIFLMVLFEKKSLIFLFGGPLRKERTREEICTRENSSVVLILSLLAFLINSLERRNEGTRNTSIALTEKEERSPHFRERAE